MFFMTSEEDARFDVTHMLESRGHGPLAASASTAGDEAAVRALLADSPSPLTTKHLQQGQVHRSSGEVHDAPRRVARIALRVDVSAGFDLSELH